MHNFVHDYGPLKSDPYQIFLVVWGDNLTHEEDAGAPTAYLLETKIIINSVISDAKQGAILCSYYIKDFLFASPMDLPE